MFDVFKKAMDAICPTWTLRLISTSSDGARNMIGRVKGIVSRIAPHVVQDSGCALVRIWCGAHQLDLAVQKQIKQFCDEDFYKKNSLL